jgi:four helix bundle protein
MEENKKKIKIFKDLDAWKEGHKLVINIYLITKEFPKEEMFGLTSQIRRAGVSITSNIAEGFGRETFKDKHHFYQIALGSILEVENQLIIAKDIGYLKEEKFYEIMEVARNAEVICRGLIKKSKSFYS